MKRIRGTVVVSVVCEVSDELFERRKVEYAADGLDFDSVLHDFVCEGAPHQEFRKLMGTNEETDWVEFMCEAEVDEGIHAEKPFVDED